MMSQTRIRSWLRHCATSRNVVGSVPDGVTGIFHWDNPSGHTMALGSTQPLREISTCDGGEGVYRRQVRRVDTLATFVCQLPWNLGSSNSWNPQGLSRDCVVFLPLLYIWPSSINVFMSCDFFTRTEMFMNFVWSNNGVLRAGLV